MPSQEKSTSFRFIFFLAVIISCISFLLYGYGRTANDDFSEYSLPALHQLHPENFANDPVFTYLSDRHYVFTKLLTVILPLPYGDTILLVLFFLTKILFYFGLLGCVAKFLDKKYLILFSGVFLFPLAEYNLVFGWMGIRIFYLVPRFLAWAFLWFGLAMLVNKRSQLGAIGLALAALIHIHFIILVIPIYALYGFLHYREERHIDGSFLVGSVMVILAIIPGVIEGAKLHTTLQSHPELMRQVFFHGFAIFHYNPRFYLPITGATFVLMSLPALGWKKILPQTTAAALLAYTSALIGLGTIAMMVLGFFELPIVVSVWYSGFSSFITVLSVIVFLVYLKKLNWPILAIVAFGYLAILFPLIAAALLLLIWAMTDWYLRRGYGKIALSAIIFAFASWLMPLGSDALSTKYPVLLHHPNLGALTPLYNYVATKTPKNATFFIPPVGFDTFRSMTLRGAFVSGKTHLYGDYLPIWEERMRKIAKIDETTPLPHPALMNTNYFALTPDDILKLGKEYSVGFFITETEKSLPFQARNEFIQIYSDENVTLFQIY